MGGEKLDFWANPALLGSDALKLWSYEIGSAGWDSDEWSSSSVSVSSSSSSSSAGSSFTGLSSPLFVLWLFSSCKHATVKYIVENYSPLSVRL